jgi:hypothetical protein
MKIFINRKVYKVRKTNSVLCELFVALCVKTTRSELNNDKKTCIL